MGPLTIIYLLHNFSNSNSWIIRFFLGGPFSFELDKFDCNNNNNNNSNNNNNIVALEPAVELNRHIFFPR